MKFHIFFAHSNVISDVNAMVLRFRLPNCAGWQGRTDKNIHINHNLCAGLQFHMSATFQFTIKWIHSVVAVFVLRKHLNKIFTYSRDEMRKNEQCKTSGTATAEYKRVNQMRRVVRQPFLQWIVLFYRFICRALSFTLLRSVSPKFDGSFSGIQFRCSHSHQI